MEAPADLVSHKDLLPDSQMAVFSVQFPMAGVWDSSGTSIIRALIPLLDRVIRDLVPNNIKLSFGL